MVESGFMPTFFSVFILKALEIVDKAKQVIEPVLERNGLELVDVEYRREPVGMVLRVFIDRPEGVDLEVCSEASACIDTELEAVEFLKEAYTLEVSSPGLERRLTKPAHFQRFVGQEVQIRRVQALEGRKKYSGTLAAADETSVSLDTDEGVKRFEYTEIAKANLKYDDR